MGNGKNTQQTIFTYLNYEEEKKSFQTCDYENEVHIFITAVFYMRNVLLNCIVCGVHVAIYIT